MKVLHLVLYSDEELYNAMYRITLEHYSEFVSQGVTTFYYMYDSTISEPILEEKSYLLRLPGCESYIPGILNKTIQALRYFSETQFDVVIRSNISSLINLTKLLPIITEKLRNMLYGGTSIITADKVHPMHGNVDSCYMPISFVHGTCIVLRRDAVQLLLQNPEFLNRETIDDVSLGVFFKRVSMDHERMNVTGVRPFTTCDPVNLGNEVSSFNSNTNVDNTLVFRNHTYPTKEDRLTDIANLQKQVAVLKQRHVTFPFKIPIREVKYHTLVITDLITVLCKQHKKWTTECKNTKLDELFGDPAPFQAKKLSIVFENNVVFEQAANLCFFWETNHLFVS